MAYARGSSDSDVYIFHHAGGWLECYQCPMLKDRKCFKAYSRQGMIGHIEEHLAKGDKVPDWAIKRLTEEITESGDKVA